MTTEGERHVLHFRTPDGSKPHFDLGDVVLTARVSRRGTTMFRFPPPFDDIEIAGGERLGAKKWARVQAAIAALKEPDVNG